MHRKSLILILFLLTQLEVGAQNLIPFPKKLIQEKGQYVLKKKERIVVRDFDLNLAASLLNELQQVQIATKVGANLKKGGIRIQVFSFNSEWKKYADDNQLDSDFIAGEEGYILRVRKDTIEIVAQNDAGAFYGIQTLRQLIRQYGLTGEIPCITIYDKPDISIRAWQDDISRGPIPTMETLKKQIRILSSYKLNYFTLYTEHVFKLEKHPKIAPKDGITKKELKELAIYAKKHFVTLIGNYQSFGHMEETLKHPDYRYLAENSHIISPALQETYEFLGDVYEEMVPLYDGAFFNINCDETFGLGKGKAKTMVDTMGVDGVYSYHINKLDFLLKKYDKKILMWGDIAAAYPNIVSGLPKDMTVIVWGYHPGNSFDTMITPISDQNLNFWVAPGINTWLRVFPNMHSTEANIYNLVRDGYKLGATGVLNTSWDDDGSNLFNHSWHGFVWGAENSWNAPPNLSQNESETHRKVRYNNFNSSFDVLFYGLNEKGKSVTELLHKLSSLHQSDVRGALSNSRFFEPVFPIHFDYVQKGKKKQNSSALEMIRDIESDIQALKIGGVKEGSLDYIEYAVRQAGFIVKKNLFRIKLHSFLKGMDAEITKESLKAEREFLIEELKALKMEYIELWRRESRENWLKENEGKFDALVQEFRNIDYHILILPKHVVTAQGREIEIRSVFNEVPIFYTINKDTVTASSSVYRKAFYIQKDAVIKARSISNQMAYDIAEIDLKQHKAVGSFYKLNSTFSTYDPSYDGGGEKALVDGILGYEKKLRSRKWQGFAGKDIEIELQFLAKEKLHYFSMGFYQNTKSWVVFPKQVEIYTKDTENSNYVLFKTIKGQTAPEVEGDLKENYTSSLDGIQPKFMKVIARYYGKLPEWHLAGSDNESMIFSDEIIIE